MTDRWRRPGPTAFGTVLAVAIIGCSQQPDAPIPRYQITQSDVILPIRVGQKWGAIDNAGTVLVKPSYSAVSYSCDHPKLPGVTRFTAQQGLVLIDEERWCYVDSHGTYVVKPQIKTPWRVVNLGEALFALKTSSVNGLSGSVSQDPAATTLAVFDPYERWNAPIGVVPFYQFSEGLIAVSQQGTCGYASRDGTIVIEPQFEFAGLFSEGLAPVKRGGKWGYTDRSGTLTISPTFEWAGLFSNGIGLVRENSLGEMYFIDKDGNRLHSWPHRQGTLFVDGLGSCFDIGKKSYGFCDQSGSWRIQPSYETPSTFNDGLAAVRTPIGEEVGYIDTVGKIRIPLPGACKTTTFRHGFAWVEMGTPVRYGYIRPDGTWLWFTLE